MRRIHKSLRDRAGVAAVEFALLMPVLAAAHSIPKTPVTPDAPELLMDGGRRLVFERSFSSEREAKTKRSFWTKVKDAVVGEPDYRSLVRPYGVAEDSRGRIVVTDPGAYGVHVFDFAQQKYKFLSHGEGDNALRAPQGVAVDSQDNIYITDSEAGKIFVFGADGKFRRVIGGLKGGEGVFKRRFSVFITLKGHLTKAHALKVVSHIHRTDQLVDLMPVPTVAATGSQRKVVGER